MNRQEKELEVQKLSDRVEKSKALIFAGYRGLKVSEMTELRAKLSKTNSLFKVVKNRLVKMVLGKTSLSEHDKYLHEPTAIATSECDPAAVAKVLVEFAKEHRSLIIKGGYLEGSELTTGQIKALAGLPSREVLLAKALSSMLSPATNLACVLSAIPCKLVRAINAIKEKKQ